MILRLPYGDGWWEEEVPALDDPFVLAPPGQPQSRPDEAQAIRRALENPVGSLRLRERVRPDATVAILVNDATRPSPTRLFLEAIGRELAMAGVPPENVSIVVATGAHRPSTREELATMLGEPLLARFRVVNHDARDPSTLVYCGETERGLPLWINRTVAEAGCRIATGTIAPHHSAGYSAGRKMILPGVAGEHSIRQYHSFPIQPPRPAHGWLEGNPAHEAALEAARRIGVDFILHAIPNPHGSGLLDVVAGDLATAHLAGCRICERACRAFFPFRADLTLCTPGGYPRDINLHQSQKALSVAELVTRPGGVITLVAECRAGIDGNFAGWLLAARTPQDVIEMYRREGWSESSGKAMMFARAVSRHTVILVTEAFDAPYLNRMFLQHAGTLNEALLRAREILGSDPKTIVIPRASGLIPLPGEPGA
ncbi:MAG TPA: nickel-dependent lactate racemase [Chloroflexi bacterium]|nr:nickel-dependent lactate racemase [Chloroflexota bacterium]